MNPFSQKQGKGIVYTIGFIAIALFSILLIFNLNLIARNTLIENTINYSENEILTDKEDPFESIQNKIQLIISDEDNIVDSDNDGLADNLERLYDANPFLNDTDFDRLLDGAEVYIYGTLPSRADSDKDGICDSVEIFIYKTNPMKKDTDGDTLIDGFEVLVLGSNALSIDSDYDMLTDFEEYEIYKTKINDCDTDKDGLSDGMEILVYKTNPFLIDTDGDSKSDEYEIDNNRNPNLADNWYHIVGYFLIPGLPSIIIIIGILSTIELNKVTNSSSRLALLFKDDSAEHKLFKLLLLVPENKQINIEELAQITGKSIEHIQHLLSEIFVTSDKKSEIILDNVLIKSHNNENQFDCNCFYCGGMIDFNTDSCLLCYETIVRCSICNRPISYNDSYATCTSCGIIGTSNEVCGAIKIELICEGCLMTLKYQYY